MPWARFGRSWALLGPSWEAIGGSCDALGTLLGRPWGLAKAGTTSAELILDLNSSWLLLALASFGLLLLAFTCFGLLSYAI